jgi:hypothetical protein
MKIKRYGEERRPEDKNAPDLEENPEEKKIPPRADDKYHS